MQGSSDFPFDPETHIVRISVDPSLVDSALDHAPRSNSKRPRSDSRSVSAPSPTGATDRAKTDKSKKSRQTQSCDACRARKVKCDRPPPGAAGPEDAAFKTTCSHCKHLGLECTFDYKPKKRGPPNLYLRKRQQEEAEAAGRPWAGDEAGSSAGRGGGHRAEGHSPHAHGHGRYGSDFNSEDRTWKEPIAAATGKKLYPPNPNKQETSEPYVVANYYRDLPPDRGGPGPGTLAEQHASRMTALGMAGAAERAILGTDVERDWEPALAMAINATSASAAADESAAYLVSDTGDLGSAGRPGGPDSAAVRAILSTGQSTGPTGFSPFTSSSPSGHLGISPYSHMPSNPSNPLDQILPRPLLHHIIDLYFDYVYPLVPCLHRPSFMADLYGHREEREGEEEWTVLVLCLVAATLCQIPRAWVSMPRRDVRELVYRCYRRAVDTLALDFGAPTVLRCITLYLCTLIAYMTGRDGPVATLIGATWGLATRLRMHEEASYVGLDPIETQLRRRVFWLLYGGDRTTMCTDGACPFLSEDDVAEVELPLALDDEYITRDGYLPADGKNAPILSGFYYISKLFRYVGQLCAMRRQDRRRPPGGEALQTRLTDVDELLHGILGLMDDCPEELRLELSDDARSTGGFSDDWDAHASQDIRSLFLDPKANKTVVKDAYLVQQGNIYPTQQMARCLALQYKEELHKLQEQEELASMASGGLQRNGRIERSDTWMEEKDQVASDLLGILQKIPIQVIAVNALPMVSKVRFVASTLLDALNTPSLSSGNKVEPVDHIKSTLRVQKAQSYLWDFLRILSEIEALYSMTDDEPAQRAWRGGEAA